MKLSSTLFLASLLLMQSACANNKQKWMNNNDNSTHSESSQHQYNPISIDIIDDQGRHFNKHQYRDEYRTHRAYLEARKGKRYQLRVRNRTNQRIAVVIAVDGRNIISGNRSNLKNSERMYVLDAYQTATYKGWRTAQNKVNRFYFSSAGDSYAAAWSDHSAMGVIAAAAYKEQLAYESDLYLNKKAPSSARAKRSHADDEAGTGYGREEHSSSINVSFQPQAAVAGKYCYKYEWRETLCEHSVIQCKPSYTQPENRLWPYNRQGNGAYAPPPPRYQWK